MSFLSQFLNLDANFRDQLNGWFILAAGFLMITGGSVSTGWFFAGCIAVVAGLLARKITIVDLRFSYFVLFAFLAFWLTMTPSFFFHENAWQGAEILGSNLQLVFVGLLLIGLLQTPSVDYMRIFLWGLRLGLPINFAIGLAQRIFTQARPEGMFGNALIFSNISVLATMLCLIGLHRENRFGKIIAVIAFTCGIASIVVGLSKSAVIAIIPAGFVLALYIWRTLKPSFTSIISIGLIGILLSGAGLWVVGRNGVLLENKILQPIERINKYGFTPRGILDTPRYYMYSNGLKSFLESPVIGVGLQNTIGVVSKKTFLNDNYKLRKYNHLHSEYLNQAVGSGILGALGLIGMLLVPLLSSAGRSIRERTRELKTFGIILFVTWSTCGITNLLTGHDLMMSAYGWCVLILLVSKYQDMRKTEQHVKE